MPTALYVFQVADMREERGSLGVAEVDGLIYAMGGGRGGPSQANLDTVEVFTPDLNAWSPGPKLHEQRFTTSAAAMTGAIYITGGFNGSAYLRTAERLDPRVGAWQPVCTPIYQTQSHPTARRWLALLAAPSANLSGTWLARMQAGMPFAAQEERGLKVPDAQVPEMPHKRGSHMSAVVGDSLYVMGGWDSEKYLDYLEVYDTRAGRWRNAPPMMTSRAYGSTAVLDDQIYMIGGLSESVSLPATHAASMSLAYTALARTYLLSVLHTTHGGGVVLGLCFNSLLGVCRVSPINAAYIILWAFNSPAWPFHRLLLFFFCTVQKTILKCCAACINPMPLRNEALHTEMPVSLDSL